MRGEGDRIFWVTAFLVSLCWTFSGLLTAAPAAETLDTVDLGGVIVDAAIDEPGGVALFLKEGGELVSTLWWKRQLPLACQQIKLK